MPDYIWPAADITTGRMNRGTIVSEGIVLAGDTGLTERANNWLIAILEDLYAAHEWPFLRRRYELSLPAGSSSLELGDGENTDDKLYHLHQVAVAEMVNNGWKGILYTRGMGEVDPYEEPAWLHGTGIPSKAIVEQSDYGQAYRWLMRFNAVAHTNLRLIVQAKYRPANLMDDLAVPLYPNAQTLIQGIYVYGLKHRNDRRWQAEQGEFLRMRAEDMLKLGRPPGSQKLRLSNRTFRRSR
jgi:hypothetical protein